MTAERESMTLQSEAFARYLAAFEQGSEKTLEQLAIAVLEDINNEVVPRWVQIVATRDSGGETEQHCQRRSKSTPLAGVKMHHLMRFSRALAVVPVVHRRDPRCFV